MSAVATKTDMNPHIARGDALADSQLWAVKYRKHPKKKNEPFVFERTINTSVLGTKTVVPLRYQRPIYQHLNNPVGLKLAIKKCRQARMSEFGINTSFFFCDKYPAFTLLYIFQDDQVGRRFLLKRIDPAIDWSVHLCEMIAEGGISESVRAKKSKQIDSLDLKKLRDAWFYMLSSKAKSASRSPDADGAIFDEYDEHDMDKEESFISTMDDSDFQFVAWISTPTMPDYGIDIRYQNSSRGKWIINCAHCGHDFEMNTEYFFGKGVMVLPHRRRTDNVMRIFVCPDCGREVKQIEKQTRGRFIHEDEGLLKANRPGYTFSNLILPHITADVAHSQYHDMMVKPGGRKKYINEKMGEACTDDETQTHLTRSNMIDCINDNVTWVENASGTFMGVDWGKETHVTIWKWHEEKIRLINYIVIPPNTDPLANAKEVVKLIPRFNPDRIMCDFGGGQEQNKHMLNVVEALTWLAVNKPSQKGCVPEWAKKIRTVYYELITAYTTYASWYAAKMVELPKYDPKLELFIQHHINSCLIDPNKLSAEDKDRHFKAVPKEVPRFLAKKGPIHILMSAIYGWLPQMGTGRKEISFSDAPEIDEKEPTFSDPYFGEIKSENIFDTINKEARKQREIIKQWQV